MSWYNEKVKKEFIDQYESIIGDYTFNTLFNKTKQIEEMLSKDCSAFNLEEILDLARSFRSSDATSLKVNMSLLRSYAQFCIDKEMSDTGLNHYTELTTQMYDDAVDKKKMAETYITRDEVEGIISQLENPRDQYIILAPYEGIYGPGLCEILELRERDLLGNNMVHLCTGREIIVSDRLYSIMVAAASEYESIYGDQIRPLQNTDKVYKGLEKENLGEVGGVQLKKKYTRLKHLLGRGTFGARMLYVSGFLNEVGKAIKEYGSFEDARPVIDEIRSRYAATYGVSAIKKMYKEAKSVKDF